MDFRLPELGEGVYEAELVNWLVKVGEPVKKGQALMEVMTDKATMEVPSPFAGRISALHVQPGQQVKVGDVVLTVGEGTQGGASPSKPARSPEATGDRVEKKGSARKAPAAYSAATPSPPRNADGAHAEPGSMTASPAASDHASNLRKGAPGLPVKAAPSVRLMARKLGVDLVQVHGSGPEGRVLIDDLTAFFKTRAAPAAPARVEARLDYGRPGSRIKLQGVRRKIAEHMVQAKRNAPHYSYVEECEITELVRLRESLRAPAADLGRKLTYLSFFVKAVVAALKEVPIVNSYLDDEAGEIVLHDRYNIGIAVAAPAGLIVPVIHDADRKDLFQIAREIENLSASARAGKSKLEELRGGTFTLTSIGNIGGVISVPVLNYPQVGILGIGRTIKRPVYDTAGNLKPADLIYLSFSFDHRVVDGAVGAAFGNAVVRHLQQPARFLLPPGE